MSFTRALAVERGASRGLGVSMRSFTCEKIFLGGFGLRLIWVTFFGGDLNFGLISIKKSKISRSQIQIFWRAYSTPPLD